jgi:hypothetical protein
MMNSKMLQAEGVEDFIDKYLYLWNMGTTERQLFEALLLVVKKLFITFWGSLQ